MLGKVLRGCSQVRPRPTFNQAMGLSSSGRLDGKKFVHEAIDYTDPFNPAESAVILDRVNTCSKEELAKFTNKTRANAIEKHRTKKGSFHKLGELLEIRALDTTTVEKLGTAILKHHTSAAAEVQEPASNTIPQSSPADPVKVPPVAVVNVSRLLKHIKPRPTIETAASLKTFCAVKLSIRTISYAKLDVSDATRIRLVDWGVLDIKSGDQKDDKDDHTTTFKVARDITNKIPEADLYVFEELIPIDRVGKKADPYLWSKIKLLELLASLVCLLNCKTDGGIRIPDDTSGKSIRNVVHIMKFTVIDDMFKLRVGTERVVLRSDKFRHVITEEYPLDTQPSQMDYYEGRGDRDREQLSLACLNALAFHRLVKESTKTKRGKKAKASDE